MWPFSKARSPEPPPFVAPTGAEEESEAQKLWDQIRGDPQTANADRDKLVQITAALALSGEMQIGVAFRLMKKITEAQMAQEPA